MYHLVVWTYLMILTLLTACSCAVNIVQVAQGEVIGHVVYAGEVEVYAFRNIPYASPPVGELRLQLPVELDSWISAEELRSTDKILCPQLTRSRNGQFTENYLGQEDCLVMDIYVRKDEMKKNDLPVLVYFHGGGFVHGSKEDYGPDFLLRYNNIILVVPNYRLGILGFLSFQDSVLPGNLGLWDQRAALKWIYNNIAQFGGDPSKITISGHEAGGTSVGLHILSPLSHGYFKNAISCSGTSFTPSLINKEQNSDDAVYGLNNILQCQTRNREELIECLKNSPVENILQAQRILKKVAFLPTVENTDENSFIPFLPKHSYLKGYQKNVNYLLGLVENEAAFDVSEEFPKVLKFQHLDKMIRHFLHPYFDNFSNLDLVIKASKYHYMKGMMIPSFESIEPVIAKIMTDFLYESPAYQAGKEHSKRAENVFMYVVLHTEQFNLRKRHCGLENRGCFGTERFIFKGIGSNALDDEVLKSMSIIEKMSKVWGNFAMFGVPDTQGKWKTFGTEHNYAEISDTIQLKTNHNYEDIEFWTSLVSDLVVARNSSHGQLISPPMPEYPIIGTWGAAGLAILCGVVCIAIIGVVLITKRRTLTMSIIPVSTLNKELNA